MHPAAAVPERRSSLYFAINQLQRHHIDVAQRVWAFASSFTMFEWLNRGDRRCVCDDVDDAGGGGGGGGVNGDACLGEWMELLSRRR